MRGKWAHGGSTVRCKQTVAGELGRLTRLAGTVNTVPTTYELQ